jgi:hypothetical protein
LSTGRGENKRRVIQKSHAAPLNGTSAGMVMGSPAEAFAKGGDSDEHRNAPSLVSERYNTWAVMDEPLKKIIGAA